MAEEPTTEVTLREVYDAVRDLQRTLDPLPDTVKDHETRLRKIESRFWGIVALVGTMGALVGKFLPALFLL